MTAPLATLLRLDAEADITLTRQLYGQLREAIVAGAFPAGMRLPSTRALARDLAISRNTVSAAFEQLALEGYVTARAGSGTRIAAPADRLPTIGAAGLDASPPVRLSRMGDALDRLERSNRGGGPAFSPGVPDPRLFPHDLWGRLLRRAARHLDPRHAGYLDYDGLPVLKRAIAAHLAEARGVGADPDHIVVLSSAQAALDLTARMLIDPGDIVAIEEPGYFGARVSALVAGADLRPVLVDGEGIVAAKVPAGARLVYVTPSHQYPSGAVMSLERRLALLDHARRNDSFIIEDDYDSEFHYRGQPVPALTSLDGAGRVVYLGTFAKAMIPAIRVAFLVLPPALAAPFRRAVRNTGQVPSVAVQAALTDLILEGHLRAHIRRVGGFYRERRDALVAALARHCPMLDPDPVPDGGMQLVARFRDPARDDVAAADLLHAHGIDCAALSSFYVGEQPRSGLLLGFAMPTIAEIDRGIAAIGRLLG